MRCLRDEWAQGLHLTSGMDKMGEVPPLLVHFWYEEERGCPPRETTFLHGSGLQSTARLQENSWKHRTKGRSGAGILS